MRHDDDVLADEGIGTPQDMHEEEERKAVYLVSTAALRNMIGSALPLLYRRSVVMVMMVE